MSKNFLKDMDMVKMKHRGREEPVVTFEPKNSGALRPRYTLWLVACMSIFFLLFSLSYLFARATVTVNPKTTDVKLNENFSASRDGSASSLPFELVVVSGEDNKIIPTTEERDAAEKSTGIVGIFNSFSSAPQILKIDTRLEGSNGKIYKTLTKTTVPGKSKSGTPGSVDVQIYADQPGAEYNSAPMDFKIIGFKGTPKYSKFYVGSKGGLTGGLKGKAPFLSDADKQNAVDDLKISLKAKLLKDAAGQIPGGYILFKDAVFLSTDLNNIDLNVYRDKTLPITMKGTLYGFLFDESKLAKKIAQDNIPQFDKSDVFIPNIGDLTFSMPHADSISFGDVKDINFNLSGAAKIVWRVRVDKLVADLTGRSKNDFGKVLLKYPNINSANLLLSPVWKLSLPDKTKDIKVIVNYPK